MKYEQINAVINQLPDAQREMIQPQFATMFEQQSLRLALVGGFSVGKSSLLNALLKEQWLHTAQEEATALPTLIQYADQTEIQLVSQDGSVSSIEREQFITVTTQAPEQAKCAVLGLNQAWLKDVVIIDLPGLGSISAQNHAYTIAQIQQSDAILYLIAPRGPSAQDIDSIQLIQSYGKHVLILISRWDDVEQAIASGEKAPNLSNWQQQIQQQTGYSGDVLPVHYQGLNHEKVLDFIESAKYQIQNIRTQRFIAELRPQLENALGHNQQQQHANAELNEQEAENLHQELLNQKNQLMGLKQSLYQQQEQETTELTQQIEKLIQDKKQSLYQQLTSIQVDIEHWDQYVHQGSQAVRLQVADAIQSVQDMMRKFGEISLSQETIANLNLRLPSLDIIDQQDFLQVAQLNYLKQQLLSKQDQQQDSEQLDDIDLSEAELRELEQSINGLIKNRNQVSNLPIPVIEERIFDHSGSAIGRKIGEMIDTALIVVPSTVILKAGKAIGIGAQALKTVKGVQQTLQGASKTIGQVLPPQVNVLDFLSVATWGEKIGSLFNKPSQLIYTPDPQKQAEVQAQIQQYNQHIQKLAEEAEHKHEIISQHKLAGFALQQKQKEIEGIEQKINQLQQDLAQQIEQAQHDQQYQQQKMLENYQQRAVRQWLNQFEKQLQGIQNHVHHYLKNYWHEVIHTQLSTRLEEVEQVQQDIDHLPQQKAETLKQLQHEQQQLQQVLSSLI